MSRLKSQPLPLFTYAQLLSESSGYDLRHEDLLKKHDLSQFEYTTVMLTQRPIDRIKYKNTPYIKTESVTSLSGVREEACRLMEQQYHHQYEFVHKIINRYYPENKTDRPTWYEAFDHYIECELQSFYPQALDNLLFEWVLYEKCKGDEEHAETEYNRLIKTPTETFKRYRKSLFLPVYSKNYTLNYAAILPKPLDALNHSCFMKQFFFMQKDGDLHYAVGCSCGSGTRYLHGLFGHFFAIVQARHYLIKSLITEIDENCQFKMIKQADHLILHQDNLVGNYPIDRKASAKILKDVTFM